MSQDWLQISLPDLDTVTEHLFSSLMEDGQDCATIEDLCEHLSTSREEEPSKIEAVPTEAYVSTSELNVQHSQPGAGSRVVPEMDLFCQESIEDLYPPFIVKLQHKIMDSAEATLKKHFYSYFTAFCTCELLKSDKNPFDRIEGEKFARSLLIDSGDTANTKRDDFLKCTSACLKGVVLGELKAERQGCEKKRKRESKKGENVC